MNKARFTMNAILVALFTLVLASLAQAQATRTWVSGVGDDVNPCSRTAPCKTFAGAISKTAANGEIDALDPAGFGAVTITKSITIDGGQGSGFGGLLASGGVNGIVISDANTATPGTIVVTLRNLSINGAGSGLIGVKILSAAKVSIENCQIFGFGTANPNGRGISDQRSNAGGSLLVTDTVVRNNGASGIVVISPGAGSTSAILNNVRMFGNASAGLACLDGSRCTISNSVASGNAGFGITAEQNGAVETRLMVENCTLSSNGTGLAITAGAPKVRISNNVITHNTTGVSGGAVETFQNNKIIGNGAGGAADNLPGGSTNASVK